MAGTGDVVVNRRGGLRPFKSGAPCKSVLNPGSSLLLVSRHQMLLLLVQITVLSFSSSLSAWTGQTVSEFGLDGFYGLTFLQEKLNPPKTEKVPSTCTASGTPCWGLCRANPGPCSTWCAAGAWWPRTWWRWAPGKRNAQETPAAEPARGSPGRMQTEHCGHSTTRRLPSPGHEHHCSGHTSWHLKNHPQRAAPPWSHSDSLTI